MVVLGVLVIQQQTLVAVAELAQVSQVMVNLVPVALRVLEQTEAGRGVLGEPKLLRVPTVIFLEEAVEVLVV